MTSSMKVVILAGGMGTRLAEETEVRPKPMVEIGGKPILWHIMKHYAQHGFREFVIALGYKGEAIKRWFLDYPTLSGDLTIDLKTGAVTAAKRPQDDWIVHLIDTGPTTNTGGRVKRLAPLLSGGTFMVTYGDGVSDVDPRKVLDFHRKHSAVATLTAVRPTARFGRIDFDEARVGRFAEKPQAGEGWINGGFLVCEPAVLEYLRGDSASLEADALEEVARENKLFAYRHEGFWQCMDTVRDKKLLESYWESGNVPWRTWT
jgi:glucose-1-phosphate cytidylyltransferase